MRNLILLLLLVFNSLIAQSSTAYISENNENTHNGLIDLSKLSIHHNISFGMTSGTNSPEAIKSQSLYSTMMQYTFNAPVTLNFNFSLPIHSTFSSAQNMNSKNIESTQYFNSIPVDISLDWKPRDNLLMKFSLTKNTTSLFSNCLTQPYDLFGNPLQ